jgi:hypothetical protein
MDQLPSAELAAVVLTLEQRLRAAIASPTPRVSAQGMLDGGHGMSM